LYMINPTLFTSLINMYLPEPHASLLNGIIFGIPIRTAKSFYTQLKTVGLLHIVVLSGMNISILANLVGIATQSFGKKISVCIAIVTIILFICFVGPQPPIIRAGCMGILSYIAILSGRQYVALFGLFLSSVFIAIFYPQWITSLSFQLSAGATLGIILFGQTKEQKCQTKTKQIIFGLYKEMRSSFAAQILTAPLIFITFKQVSFISIVSNLFVSWTIIPLMIFGFLTSVLGTINFYLGIPIAYLCYGLLSYFIFIVDTLSKIPFAFVQF